MWLVTEVPRCQCRGCGRVFEAASLALAYVHYTERLNRNVVALSRRMMLADLSALTGLDWDRVKGDRAKQLQHDYDHLRLNALKYCGFGSCPKLWYMFRNP